MKPPRSPDDAVRAADDRTLPTPDATQVQLIRTYGPGRFLIGEHEWCEPVLVTPFATVPWRAARAEEVSPDLLKEFGPVELLVVGCGPRSVFLPPALRGRFKAAGIGLEVVDTGAACRIYNVLLAESRKVGAALIPL